MEDIVIRDPKGLQRKITEFKNDGAKGFHVVADFDGTLTKGFVNGKSQISAYESVRKTTKLSTEYKRKYSELYHYYYPIEQSNKISLNVKKEKMTEWWEKHYSLMVESGFYKKIILDVIKKRKTRVRLGTIELLDSLSKNKIPFLIFSAGLGDFIKEYLISIKKQTRNIHIISNFFRFDKKGKAVGFNRPLIHTFNKNETEVKRYSYKKDVNKRKNVILLGDLVADLDMTEGIAHDSIIRIGFLNRNVEKLLPKYKKAFDVVILNDGPMDFVNSLVEEIINQ